MANHKPTDSRLEKKRRWKRIMGEWKTSGLGQAAFCRKKGISLSTFCRWKRSLEHVRDEKGIGFVPIKVVDTKNAGAFGAFPIEILLGRGKVVRLQHGFDAGELESVIRILEAASC